MSENPETPTCRDCGIALARPDERDSPDNRCRECKYPSPVPAEGEPAEPWTDAEIAKIRAEIPLLVQPERSLLRWLATHDALLEVIASLRRSPSESVDVEKVALAAFDDAVLDAQRAFNSDRITAVDVRYFIAAAFRRHLESRGGESLTRQAKRISELTAENAAVLRRAEAAESDWQAAEERARESEASAIEYLSRRVETQRLYVIAADALEVAEERIKVLEFALRDLRDSLGCDCSPDESTGAHMMGCGYRLWEIAEVALSQPTEGSGK